VLELRSVRGTGGGPDKTILLGTARTDRRRFDITVCYIRDVRDAVFDIDDRAIRLGLSYTELLERHSFDPRVWPQLRTLVRERQIQIVHAHDYKTDVLAWLLAMAVPVVPLATVHGWSGHSWREERLYYPADRWVLRRYPRLIAVSEEIRGMLIASGSRPERVVTIPNGIDASQFARRREHEADVRHSLGLSDGSIAIGAVGRLGPEKRYDLLVEAFDRLAAQDARVHLFIVGDGDLRSDLERRMARCTHGARMHLLGQRADVARLHHAFDVFALCSDHEGAPNAVLEAMALETPIVATAVGAIPEMAPDGTHALLVRPGDPVALAAALGRAVADPQASRQRAEAARRRVETVLSFDHRMARVEEVYVDLTGRRRGMAA
jgi:glycosyltransferase involved in cell wall biosynthesis